MFMETEDWSLKRKFGSLLLNINHTSSLFSFSCKFFAKENLFTIFNIPISSLCLFLMSHWFHFILAHSSVPSTVLSVHMYLYICFSVSAVRHMYVVVLGLWFTYGCKKKK